MGWEPGTGTPGDPSSGWLTIVAILFVIGLAAVAYIAYRHLEHRRREANARHGLH